MEILHSCHIISIHFAALVLGASEFKVQGSIGAVDTGGNEAALYDTLIEPSSDLLRSRLSRLQFSR